MFSKLLDVVENNYGVFIYSTSYREIFELMLLICYIRNRGKRCRMIAICVSAEPKSV